MAGITGKDSLSIKKQDVSQSRVPALGFKKTVFAHKATAGQTVISLSSLTTPTEMTANGFAQPSLQELTAVNIRQFKENFTLRSSIRGELLPFLGYVVTGGTSLKLLFNAEDGEIFVGTFDANPRTFTSAADAVPISVSGTLLAGQTDFNVGTAFNVGLYPGSQHGAIMVFLNDRLCYRNTTPTSLGTADGDYYEVPAGNGQGVMIRFNQADPSLDRAVSVISIGSLIQAPNGSEVAMIEALQGQIDAMVPTLAALAGVDPSTFQVAPNNVNLKAFGDAVLAAQTTITAQAALITALQAIAPKAYVRFNAAGVIASSYNVASVVRDGADTGDWIVSFVNAMPNANYTAVVTASDNVASANGGVAAIGNAYAYNTGNVRVSTATHTGTASDMTFTTVVIF